MGAQRGAGRRHRAHHGRAGSRPFPPRAQGVRVTVGLGVLDTKQGAEPALVSLGGWASPPFRSPSGAGATLRRPPFPGGAVPVHPVALAAGVAGSPARARPPRPPPPEWAPGALPPQSEEHTSGLQSPSNFGCRLLLEKTTPASIFC